MHGFVISLLVICGLDMCRTKSISDTEQNWTLIINTDTSHDVTVTVTMDGGSAAPVTLPRNIPKTARSRRFQFTTEDLGDLVSFTLEISGFDYWNAFIIRSAVLIGCDGTGVACRDPQAIEIQHRDGESVLPTMTCSEEVCIAFSVSSISPFTPPFTPTTTTTTTHPTPPVVPMQHVHYDYGGTFHHSDMSFTAPVGGEYNFTFCAESPMEKKLSLQLYTCMPGESWVPIPVEDEDECSISESVMVTMVADQKAALRMTQNEAGEYGVELDATFEGEIIDVHY